MSYTNHSTVLTVPVDYVSAATVFTLTYEGLSNMQGDLQGMDHFFSLTTDAVPGTGWALPGALRLLLGFGPNPITTDTLALYYLAGGVWTTDTITVVTRTSDSYEADVAMTGVYGLLGNTNRVYMPVITRLR